MNPHWPDFEESFIILEGEIEATFRGVKSVAGAGETIHIPANAPHQFHNKSDGSARLPCICSPAGQEEFFAQVGVAVATGTTAPPKLDETAQAEFKPKAEARLPVLARRTNRSARHPFRTHAASRGVFVTTEPRASPSSERIGFVSVNKSIQMLEIAEEHVAPQRPGSVIPCRLLLEVVAQKRFWFAHVVAILAVRSEVGVFGFGVAAV
jgi:Cupin domain